MTIVAIVIIGVCIGGGLLLLMSLFLSPGKGDDASYLNRGTRFFLLALRLVIGWHLLVEGIQKLENPNWPKINEGYLHASVGPLGKQFREAAAEPLFAKLQVDEDCRREVAKLTASQIGAVGVAFTPGALIASSGLYPGNVTKVPPALDRHLVRYLKIFNDEMILDEGVLVGTISKKAQEAGKAQQKVLQTRARMKLDQAKAMMLLWLTTPQPVEKPSPYLSRPDVFTIGEQIAYYKELMDQVEHTANTKVAAFGKGAQNDLTNVWNEAQLVYASLKRNLGRHEEQLRKDLQSIFDDPVKKRLAPPKMPTMPRLEITQKPLHWADLVIPWALCIIGAGLLLGLFTRTNCFLGAVLLLTIYVTMPPLPGWPANPRAEGNYLFINKNVIEMVALLVLATTASGRWLGIDGIVGYFLQFIWRILLRVIKPSRGKATKGA